MTTLIAAWYLSFVYPGSLMGRQFGPFENEQQCLIAKKDIGAAMKKQYIGWDLSEKQGVCYPGVR